MWGHVIISQCKTLGKLTNQSDNCVQCLRKRHNLTPQFETIHSDGTKEKKKKQETV